MMASNYPCSKKQHPKIIANTIPRSLPSLEISIHLHSHHGGDARGQTPQHHHQAPAPIPIPLCFRPHRSSSALPPPLRHLLPATAAVAADTGRRRRLPRLPNRVQSGRRCLPLHHPAAGLRGRRPRPGAAPAVLRRRHRLGSVLIGVLFRCHSLVCWCIPSILCCFGPPRESWINCMHRCWRICTCSFQSERYQNASILVIAT